MQIIITKADRIALTKGINSVIKAIKGAPHTEHLELLAPNALREKSKALALHIQEDVNSEFVQAVFDKDQDLCVQINPAFINLIAPLLAKEYAIFAQIITFGYSLIGMIKPFMAGIKAQFGELMALAVVAQDMLMKPKPEPQQNPEDEIDSAIDEMLEMLIRESRESRE